MDFHRAMAALRAALADSPRAKGAPDLVEQVLDLVRPSIGLAVPARSRNGATADSVAGWYGGLPGLPDGVPWPEYLGRPMTLLAQLDCAVLAPLYGPEWTLPRDGVLLFFSEEWFHADFGAGPDDDRCAVLHVPAGAPRRDAPAETVVIPALPLDAAPVLAAPDYTEPELAALFSTDPIRVMGLVSEIRDRLPTVRHRLLGWLDSQLPGPAGHRPLLALEAEQGTAWGELVGVSFWVGGPDLAAGRFSPVRRVLEVA